MFLIQRAKSGNKCRCQPCVGNERNVEIYSTAADNVPVGKFATGNILRNIDDQVELIVGNHLLNVVFASFIRPIHIGSCNAVIGQKLLDN